MGAFHGHGGPPKTLDGAIPRCGSRPGCTGGRGPQLCAARRKSTADVKAADEENTVEAGLEEVSDDVSNLHLIKWYTIWNTSNSIGYII